jgi:hypothetical protein
MQYLVQTLSDFGYHTSQSCLLSLQSIAVSGIVSINTQRRRHIKHQDV